MKNIVKQIPNFLTISRLVLVLIAYYFLLFNNYEIAIILVIIAGLTDIFDGMIARKYKLVSKLGAKLDQIVDKVFEIVLMAAGILLGNQYLLVNLSLEILFLIVCLIKVKQTKKWIVSIKIGKIKTALLFLTIIISLLGIKFSNFQVIFYVMLLITSIVQIITIYSYIKTK